MLSMTAHLFFLICRPFFLACILLAGLRVCCPTLHQLQRVNIFILICNLVGTMLNFSLALVTICEESVIFAGHVQELFSPCSKCKSVCGCNSGLRMSRQSTFMLQMSENLARYHITCRSCMQAGNRRWPQSLFQSSCDQSCSCLTT